MRDGAQATMEAAMQAAMAPGVLAEQTNATIGAKGAQDQHNASMEHGVGLLKTWSSMQATWRNEMALTNEEQSLHAQMTADVFNTITTDTLEPWKAAYTGVGSLVHAQNQAMQASFARWGTFTRSTSQITADKLKADFDALLATGTATAIELQAAWEKAEEAKREASTSTSDSVKMSWSDSMSSIAGSLAQLGGKWKAFALAEGTAAGALAILKAWSALPWPANLPGVAAATVATAVNVAKIASSGFETGTPNLDFANFGNETIAALHGQEAVIPKGGGHSLAREVASELRAMGGARGGSTGGTGASAPMHIELVTPNGDAIMNWLIPSIEKATKTRRLRIHPNSTKREF